MHLRHLGSALFVLAVVPMAACENTAPVAATAIDTSVVPTLPTDSPIPTGPVGGVLDQDIFDLTTLDSLDVLGVRALALADAATGRAACASLVQIVRWDSAYDAEMVQSVGTIERLEFDPDQLGVVQTFIDGALADVTDGTVVTPPTAGDAATIRQLDALEGRAFDATFVDAMLAVRQAIIDVATPARIRASRAAIRVLANNSIAAQERSIPYLKLFQTGTASCDLVVVQ